jgi:DNA-binding MarR family transcriptional regulator
MERKTTGVSLDPELEGGSGTEQSTKAALRLWLRLLTLTTTVEQVLRKNLRTDHDTTMPRFDVMAALYNEPESSSMGEISRRLMVSNGNVTGIVDRLQREGMIDRRQRLEDRRSHVVRLTDSGREAFEEMAEDLEGWVASLFSELDEVEIEQLYELLGKAKRSVQSNEEEGSE